MLYCVYLIIFKNCQTVHFLIKKPFCLYNYFEQLFCWYHNLWETQLLYIPKALSMVRFINFSHSNWCLSVSSCDFNFHIFKYLISHMTENIFNVLIWHFWTIFCKVYIIYSNAVFSNILPILTWFYVFLLLSCISLIYSEYKSFISIYFTSIFSQLVTFLLFLKSFLGGQKFSIMKFFFFFGLRVSFLF